MVLIELPESLSVIGGHARAGFLQGSNGCSEVLLTLDSTHYGNKQEKGTDVFESFPHVFKHRLLVEEWTVDNVLALHRRFHRYGSIRHHFIDVHLGL
jgi:hypothetical protein